jgi:hypothetical protein
MNVFCCSLRIVIQSKGGGRDSDRRTRLSLISRQARPDIAYLDPCYGWWEFPVLKSTLLEEFVLLSEGWPI